jgi:broad specificity phosphatase PhoE
MSISNRLIFVRHGETDWNVAGRLQGHRDIPINARGRAQADSVGHKLRDMFAPEYAKALQDFAFFSSPMVRTCETMERVKAICNMPPKDYVRDSRLMEITFGAWEGLTWGEIKKDHPNAVKDREKDKWNYRPYEGESYANVEARVQDWLETLKQDTLVVSHGGVGRVLMVLAGNVPRQYAVNADVIQGRMMVFEAGTLRWT